MSQVFSSKIQIYPLKLCNLQKRRFGMAIFELTNYFESTCEINHTCIEVISNILTVCNIYFDPPSTFTNRLNENYYRNDFI